MTTLSDEELLQRAVRYANGPIRLPRSTHVGRIFFLASGPSTALCQRFGIDPDERVSRGGQCDDESREGGDDS